MWKWIGRRREIGEASSKQLFGFEGKRRRRESLRRDCRLPRDEAAAASRESRRNVIDLGSTFQSLERFQEKILVHVAASDEDRRIYAARVLRAS
jgi:hypothetical protein